MTLRINFIRLSLCQQWQRAAIAISYQRQTDFSFPMSEQTIFRTAQSKDFTVLPNSMLRDSRLSFKARGVLAMILTNQSEWIVTSAWIESQGTEGREAIRSATDELKALGYAKFTREKTSLGTFKNVWCFFDVPTDDGNPSFNEPMTGTRQTANRRRQADDGNPSDNQKDDNRKPLNKKKTEFPTIPQSLETPEFTKAWNEWLEDRRTRKKPITALAAIRQLENMEKWGVQKSIQAINNSIENGWQGIFEPKASDRKKDNRPLVVDFGDPSALANNPFQHLTSGGTAATA